MATFDPKNRPQGNNSNDGVPGGDYLLIIKNFQRRTGKASSKPYLRTCFEVIHGPAKGKTFFDSMSIDMDNGGAMARLSMLAEQVDSGAFDLDSDAEIKQALVRKPFKARVSREVNGQYVNNGISRYLNKEITDFDRRVMETWVFDDAERQQHGGGGGYGVDGDGLPDDDAPHPASGGNGYNDDIPF